MRADGITACPFSLAEEVAAGQFRFLFQGQKPSLIASFLGFAQRLQHMAQI